MQIDFARPTGPGAAVVKYDVLTALCVMALRSGPTVQMSVLRLIALMTARYNWKRDYFTVPQADMARLWNVSERTVKREIKRMVTTGLVTCVRPGVRGRVGAYRLNYAYLSGQTNASWSDVGPDYQERMARMMTPTEAKVVKVDFAQKAAVLPPETLDVEGCWGAVLQDLARQDPANLQNWYMKLQWVSAQEGRVVLSAPSGFVAQFVQTHLTRVLVPALARQIGRPITLEIIC